MRDNEAHFVWGWIIWAILAFCIFGWSHFFGNSLIPISSGTYHEDMSILGWVICMYLAGWPFLGFAALM